MNTTSPERAVAALADPSRRGIVVHLAFGEAAVSDWVARFHRTQPAISPHLRGRESAGLMTRRRIAQQRPYRLVRERRKAVADGLEEIQQIREENDPRLDALPAELKSAQNTEQQR